MARVRRTKQASLEEQDQAVWPTEAAELAHLHQLLAEAGAPPDVLAAFDQHDSSDAVLGALHEIAGTSSPDEIFAEMLSSWQPLADSAINPVDAEVAGYEFLDMFRQLAPDGEDIPEMFETLVSQGEAHGDRAALAMLRSLAVTGPRTARGKASAAADRLVASGIADVAWSAGLGAPKPGRCFGYADPFGLQETIVLTFGYGRRRHAVAVLIDHSLGGGVKDCWVSDQPTRIRNDYAAAAAMHGLALLEYSREEAADILNRALDNDPCPEQPDQVEDVRAFLDLLRRRAALLTAGGAADMPARGASGAPSVHRMKITLRGSKPPIWRRLEVPSTASLAKLHQAIQEAFGWHGDHLWVFETAHGAYGRSDPELGHRSASSRRLAQVAPRVGDRLRYTYDFGDDWVHEITVEEVGEAEPRVAYPRCLTGRRAAPPDDCGGIWGYEALLEILSDPSHPDHEGTLEWMGLESPDDLDSAAFAVDEVNDALTSRVLVRKP